MSIVIEGVQNPKWDEPKSTLVCKEYSQALLEEFRDKLNALLKEYAEPEIDRLMDLKDRLRGESGSWGWKYIASCACYAVWEDTRIACHFELPDPYCLSFIPELP